MIPDVTAAPHPSPFPSRNRRCDKVAFTMVELLIVIAIITVLLAMVMSGVNRARQQAMQTHCLSNLRQLGTVYLVYASTNGGQVPLGYSNGMPWNGYFLWDSINYPLAGRVFKAKLMDDSPRTFYCPSQIDARWQYNTLANPWPSQTVNPSGSLQIRVGYTARPSVEWAPGSFQPTGPMTRLQTLKSKAMLSDVVGIPRSSVDYTNIHHRSLNVLYADSSVRSVDRSAYDGIQKLIQPYNAVPNAVPLTLYLQSANPNANALWNVFDRH